MMDPEFPPQSIQSEADVVAPLLKRQKKRRIGYRIIMTFIWLLGIAAGFGLSEFLDLLH